MEGLAMVDINSSQATSKIIRLGGNNSSFFPKIADDGSKVAFFSEATNLVDEDSNDTEDIFVYDLGANEITRPFDANSFLPIQILKITSEENGSKLAFKNSNGGIYVFDLNNNEILTEISNVSSDAFEEISVNADSSKIAFISGFDLEENTLVLGEDAVVNTIGDVFVFDLNTEKLTSLIGDFSSISLSINGEGDKIAFESYARNFVENDTNRERDIFVYDLESKNTTRISGNNIGTVFPEISADGNKVVFESFAFDPVTNEYTFNLNDLMIYDLNADEITTRIRVSNLFGYSINADGSRIAFASNDPSLFEGDNNNKRDIFVFDTATEQIVRIAGNGDSFFPSITADGSKVTFASSASNLVPGDNNNTTDIFVAEVDFSEANARPLEPDFNLVSSTPENDELIGTKKNDEIFAKEGNDTIFGNAGNDLLWGQYGNDTITGGKGRDLFIFSAAEGFDIITDFGGIGRGFNPTQATVDRVDTLQFSGDKLDAENLLLTQLENDLEITFEGAENTKVILQNFAIEQLDNLPSGVGNILFASDSRIEDNFDVFDSNQTRSRVFNRDTVTFLNDLDNTTQGFNNSNDIINAQGGEDILLGRSGNDILRGGDGNDILLDGGEGNDLLDGGLGDDGLFGGDDKDVFTLKADRGTDTVFDFNSRDDRFLLDGLSFEELTISGDGDNTLISITDTSETIAILLDVRENSILPENFDVA